MCLGSSRFRHSRSPSSRAADLVTAADTTPEHAQACAELVEKVGGVDNAGAFTPWRYRAEGAPPATTLGFPGGLGGANWGGTAFDPTSRLLLVATQDVGALGSMEKAKGGSLVPYEKTTPGRATFDVRIGDANWPCQKPPWGRLTAINTSTGEIAWQVPLGITDQLPPEKQHTGRPLLAGPIVTASGLVFIASTDDNRFRALDVKTGKRVVGDEARAKRECQSDHVSRQERPTVRRRRRHRQCADLRITQLKNRAPEGGPAMGDQRRSAIPYNQALRNS